MKNKRIATCKTAEEFMNDFMTQSFEIAPWPQTHIIKKKINYSFKVLSDFDVQTHQIKAAMQHVKEMDSILCENEMLATDQDDQNRSNDQFFEESNTKPNSPNKSKSKQPINNSVPEISDDQDYNMGEEEEEEEEAESENDNLRTSYMKNSREPITSLPSVFKSLSSEFQNIIRPNSNTIFSMKLYQQQMYFVLSLTKGKLQRDIGKFFGIKPGTVYSHFKRMQNVKQKVGKPKSLTNSELEMIKSYIQQRYNENNVATTHSVEHYIYDEFNKVIKSGTLTKLLNRLKVAKSLLAKPIDSTRAEVPIDDIKEYYSKLDAFFSYHKVQDHFVLNTDESGFQPFANAKPEHVYVPISEDPKDLYYPVNRQAKRSTLVATIAADGTTLDTVIIITRTTVEKELFHMGYRPNCGYYYASQENGFITADIWDYWAQTIFFPEIVKRRQKMQYSGPVVLLIDSCTAHFSNFFLDECVFYGVFVFTEPPSSSDQLQVLDLGLFGIQKKNIKRVNVRKGVNEQTEMLVQILNSWENVAHSSNITSAFEQAGFIKYQIEGEDDQIFYIKVDINNAIRVRGLQTSPVIHGDELKKRVKVRKFE